MSSDQAAIRVDDVSKQYLLFDRPEDRLKQMVVPRLKRWLGLKPANYYRSFASLSGVSFSVARGETVGIVGRNGSGKSTLLQIICGTLTASKGKVEVNGRIAALLELGAGFNPEFTGRENVYLNAAILGLSRSEVDERFDSIARFADIGAFIDQPVKTYSSGMYVRLAFATAVNVDPDILVVDEALAVGDEAFQRKCYARIGEIKERGGTILFVSHSAQTIVQLCDRALLIDAGELLLEGRPKEVVSQYQRLLSLSNADLGSGRERIKAVGSSALSPAEREAPACAVSDALSETPAWLDPTLVSHSRVEYASRGVRISDARICTPAGRQVNVLKANERYIYEYAVDFDEDAVNVGFGMSIKTVDGVALGGGATDFSRSLRLPLAKAGSHYRVRFDLRWSLNTGVFFLNAGVTGEAPGFTGHLHRVLDILAFRIAPRPDLVATGYIDFDPRPSFELAVSGARPEELPRRAYGHT